MREEYDDIKYLTLEQQRLFVAALQAGAVKNETARDALYIQLMTGMRPGEVIALCWQDIDFENGTVTVAHTVHRTKETPSQLELGETKTHSKREVPLSSEALGILEMRRLAVLEGDVEVSELVFANRRGGLIEPNGLNRYLKQCRAKMQELAPKGTVIPKFTAHALRHTFATRALEAGVPLKVVSDWLGHSSVRITGDVYTHKTPECSQKWRAAMDSVIKF